MGLPRNDEQQSRFDEFPFNFDDPNYQLVEDGYGVHLPKGEVVYVGDTLKGLDKQPSSSVRRFIGLRFMVVSLNIRCRRFCP